MPEEFSFIDRCALIVRPTWKFVEWLNQLDDRNIPDETSVFTQTVYLVEEINSFDAAGTAAILEAYFIDIAANEFASWWTEEADWPAIRNLNDFFQYFECSPSEMVVDLADEDVFDN